MLYKLVRAVAKVFFRIVFFIEYENADAVNKYITASGCVIASNHICLFDPVFIACALKREIHYMAKAELFNNRLFSGFLKGLNAFPVNREKADVQAVKTSLGILKNKKILGIFPQGTRVSPNETINAKLGTVQFAIKTGSPIIPVGVNTRGGRVRAFKKVTVKFGEPIVLKNMGITDTKPENLQKASDYLMLKISELAAN